MIKNEILIYKLPEGDTKVEVYMKDNDLWMTQTAMAELFQTTKANITMHIQNIYQEGELNENSTSKWDLLLQKEGSRLVKRKLKLYNLKTVISVGFRTKSSIATLFRAWANDVINEFMIKGYVIDDKRLEDPTKFGKDYFDELYLRIKAIRASEKRFYQKILEIYSTSIDYNKNDEQTLVFYKTVQNKLHYAVTGETAAELIYNRSDSNKVNMGLTSWRGMHVQKSDVTIAKNYLSKNELDLLNQIVNMYLDHAERMAQSNIPMYMKDWKQALDEFLKFERMDILNGKGKISNFLAEQKALKEYEKFDFNREKLSDNYLDNKLLELIKNRKK